MLALKSNSILEIKSLNAAEANFKELHVALREISCLYPNFYHWLHFTFRVGLIKGSRSVLAAYINGEFAGVSLLKHSDKENKVCTLFVFEKFRSQTVGTQLLSDSIDLLCSKSRFPIGITVAQERNEAIYPILTKKGFILTEEKNGFYRKGITEFFYSLK